MLHEYSRIAVVVVTVMLAVSGFHVLTKTPEPQSVSAGKPGEIVGRVVDLQGQPVPKAKVHVRLVGANPTGRIIFYWADAEGNFSIKGLASGEYDIFVSKEEDGFPDTDFFFYSSKQTSVAQASVTGQQPPPFVTVPIGPKAGRITGRVVNAVTGAPIGNATMRFSRPENQYMVLIASPHLADDARPYQPGDEGAFNFLLPAAPLTIKVTAPGHVPWNYRSPGSNKQMDLLTLEPGKTMEMVIRMRPVR